MIFISPTYFDAVCAHGEAAYPEECCGAMLGLVKATGEKHITQIVPLENHAAEIRHRRFEITAADYAELESKARAQDLILLGFYHTHPDHPARPSATDLAYAWPFFSYIILTVSAGKAGEMAAFVLDEDTMQFVSEQLHKG